jgi:hypothetical protein
LQTHRTKALLRAGAPWPLQQAAAAAMAEPGWTSAFANGAEAAAQECPWSRISAGKPPLSVPPLEELPPEVNALLKDQLHSLDFAFTISDPTKVRRQQPALSGAHPGRS